MSKRPAGRLRSAWSFSPPSVNSPHTHLACHQLGGVVVAALTIVPAVPGLGVDPKVRGQQLLVVPHDLTVAVELACLAGLLLYVGQVLEHPRVGLPVRSVVYLLVVVSY